MSSLNGFSTPTTRRAIPLDNTSHLGPCGEGRATTRDRHALAAGAYFTRIVHKTFPICMKLSRFLARLLKVRDQVINCRISM